MTAIVKSCRFFLSFIFVYLVSAFLVDRPVNAQNSNSEIVVTSPTVIQSHTIKLNNSEINMSTAPVDLSNSQTLTIVSGAKQARKSGPICGGYGPDGKIQPRCGKKPAQFTSAARGKCPKGSFFDIGKWACYSCPSGYKRTIFKVDGDRACSKRDKSVKGKFGKANYMGPVCPKGSFFDGIRGGECRKCPSGYKRTIAHVDTKTACAKKPIIGPFAKASHLKKASCGTGEFKDALYNKGGSKGGTCWTCPKTWTRTVFAVHGSKACEKGGGYRYKTATDKGALTCPKGQIFDFIGLSKNDIRTRPELKGKSIKTVKSGTCWSCPSGYDRTASHVKKSGACEAKTMAWYSAPYKEPGFFGLKGAEAVLLDITKQRPDLIQGAIDAASKAAAKDKNGKVNQSNYKKNLAAERKTFVNEPHNSVSAAGAAFTRLMIVVGNQKKATAAEKELLNSFKNYIIAKRTHIAEDALAAYDAWLRADTYWKSKNRGGTNMAVLFDYGTVPPDFSVIAMTNSMGLGVVDFALGQGAEKVVGDAIPMIGDILSLGLNIATNTDSIADPSQAWRWAMRTAAETAIGKAADFAVTKLAKVTAAALYKQVGAQFAHLGAPKLVQAAATQAGKGVLSAAGSAGPQIIITASIMIGTMAFDQMMEIKNARPKLKNALANAKYPPDLARMAKTEEGMTELLGYWSQAISEHPKPSSKYMLNYKRVANAALAKKINISAKKTSAKKTSAKKTSALRLKGRWSNIKGSALDIGVGASGKIWVIGSNKSSGGYGIYRWDRKWTKIKGGATRIAVDTAGNAWVVNSVGKIYRYFNRRWLQIKGPKAIDIGVGARGHVWVIGGKKESGGLGIYRLEKNKRWRKINGSAVRIAVGPKGLAWVVNSVGKIYRFDGRRWIQIKGPKAKDIGISANGKVWIVGGKKGRNGYQVWTLVNKRWKRYNGELTNIAVGPKGRPFGVNAGKKIFVMN